MKQLSHAASIIPVSDMTRSLNFYSEVLGFEKRYLHNDPVDYAVLGLNDISLHLTLSDAIRPEDSTRIYFFVHDVDEVYTAISEKYDGKLSAPELWDYGMRDFDVIDPDGHRLAFGKHEG